MEFRKGVTDVTVVDLVIMAEPSRHAVTVTWTNDLLHALRTT